MVLVYFLTVEFEYDVFCKNPCIIRRRQRCNGGAVVGTSNENTVVNRELLFFSDVGGYDHISNTKKWNFDATGFFHRINVALGSVDRNSKTDILRARRNRGVDANHLSPKIEERPSRITRIDCGIGLDNSLDRL